MRNHQHCLMTLWLLKKMTSDKPFWQTKMLKEMTAEEWESLCDGCAKCCLHKLEDDETFAVYYTDVACKYLDEKTCRCKDYDHRNSLVPDCITLKVEDVHEFFWLPQTCAYRLIAERKPLPEWHHLVSGSRETIHEQKKSVIGRIVLESNVEKKDMQDHVIRWIK